MRKSRHDPWQNVKSPRETVPSKWITPCVFSDDLLPFAVRPETTKAVIPLGEDGMLEEHPENEIYWEKADKLYEENRSKGKTTPKTLLSRIDFHSELKRQLPIMRGNSSLCHLVYNGSGQHMRAARCCGLKIVVEAGISFGSPDGLKLEF